MKRVLVILGGVLFVLWVLLPQVFFILDEDRVRNGAQDVRQERVGLARHEDRLRRRLDAQLGLRRP